MATEPSTASKIRGALIGLAVCDALGGPVEFKKRGTFDKVTSMLPNGNFSLPPGCFTDDTSMALCLANSLLDCGGRHDIVDQVRKYLEWYRNGYMSSTGYCVDIGNATRMALSNWSNALRELDGLRLDSPARDSAVQDMAAEIRKKFSKEVFCGNGSLMRVLPVALIATDDEQALTLAKLSSQSTHPHQRCADSCAIYIGLVYSALQGATKDHLAARFGNSVSGSGVEPTLRDKFGGYRTIADWNAKTAESVKSSGYVVDSLEAAMWAFFTTEEFEEGAIRVVNLGDDADTVGAIYGGLAGAFYGAESIPEHWLAQMQKMELLNNTLDKILAHRAT